MLNKTATLLGSFIGYWMHFFRGCKPFTRITVGPKGKAKSKTCNRCKKRWDRTNGKWKYVGYYK